MRFNPCARRRKQNAVRRTLFSVEVDLDGGVSARVEDLTRRWGLVSTREVALSALPYLTSVDTGDRHGSSQSAELKGSGVRDRLYLIEKKKRSVLSAFVYSHGVVSSRIPEKVVIMK